jgi:hypothetical protein
LAFLYIELKPFTIDIKPFEADHTVAITVIEMTVPEAWLSISEIRLLILSPIRLGNIDSATFSTSACEKGIYLISAIKNIMNGKKETKI